MKQIITFWMIFVFLSVSAQAKDSLQLDSLYRKVDRSVNMPSFLSDNAALLKEARAQNNKLYEARACYCYVHYYCNNYKEKELSLWLEKLEVAAAECQDIPLLFVGKYMLIKLYCMKGDMGLALIEARTLYKEALRLKSQQCLDIACLSIADVYVVSNQAAEATAMLWNVLKDEKQIDMSSPEHALALSFLSIISLSHNDVKSAKKYLDLLDGYTRRHYVLGGKTDKLDIPLLGGVLYFNVCVGYASYYLLLDKPDLSLQYIRSLDAMVNEATDVYYLLMQRKAYVSYYIAVKNREKAMEYLDAAISLSRQVGGCCSEDRVIRKKADLLMSQRQNKEAMELYKEVIALKNSAYSKSYIRQIGVFNTQFQIDKIGQENTLLKIEKKTLYGWILSLVVLCVCLLMGLLLINCLKKKLKKAKRKAEDSERLKSMFLANMNHEIRTPLNAIAGFSELLIDETEPEICRQYADIIKDSNELLLRLINDVLDISKIEAGAVIFSYTDVQLSGVMNVIYQTMKLRVSAPVELILEAHDPDVILYTDRDRLIQIITNFLTNACKHTTSGFIRFGYKLKEDEVYIFVSDTGDGISEGSQKDLFTRFVQGTDQKGGVGLGLALCHGFVIAMGGKIGVHSKVNEGSTFWFTLPQRGSGKIKIDSKK